MEIDLMKFCSRDSYRANIKEPFSKGKWTYATDSHIIIRVPKLPSVPKNPKAPNAETVFMEADKLEPYEWIDVPEVKIRGRNPKTEPIKIPFGESMIGLSNIYLNLIRKELPNPKLGLHKQSCSVDTYDSAPVKIRFTGGIGLLMPMRL